MSAFPLDEYEDRLEQTKARMRSSGIDVLWVTSPPNMNYLSGYDAWSFYVHQGLLVGLDVDQPIWIGRKIDIPCLKHTSFLAPESAVGYGDEFLAPPAHAMDCVAAVIESRGWAGSVVGVEMDAPYFTALAYERLRAGLPHCRIVNADRLVNWVRIVKSPREIEYLTQAGEITNIAMQTGIEAIAPGVRQCDVAGAVYRALISGHPSFCGDAPDYQTMPKGRRTDAPHLTWTDERYTIGEVCTLELGANRFRYHAPLSRTVHVGKPPERLVTLAETVREGLESALDGVRPGVTCESIEAAWRRVAAKAGIKKESRIGYSVGLGYPPDWGERTASLMPGDHTVLQPNMVFHLILGIWGSGAGYELSETFRVTAGGYACFSKLPRTLMVRHGGD